MAYKFYHYTTPDRKIFYLPIAVDGVIELNSRGYSFIEIDAPDQIDIWLTSYFKNEDERLNVKVIDDLYILASENTDFEDSERMWLDELRNALCTEIGEIQLFPII